MSDDTIVDDVMYTCKVFKISMQGIQDIEHELLFRRS